METRQKLFLTLIFIFENDHTKDKLKQKTAKKVFCFSLYIGNFQTTIL